MDSWSSTLPRFSTLHDHGVACTSASLRALHSLCTCPMGDCRDPSHISLSPTYPPLSPIFDQCQIHRSMSCSFLIRDELVTSNNIPPHHLRNLSVARCIRSESVAGYRDVPVACPPNPDPPTMRVSTGRGTTQETLEDEADKAFGGADREQAA